MDVCMDSNEELHVVIKTEKQQTKDEQESFGQETMFFNTSNILPVKHETDEDAGEMYICNTENLQFCKNEGEITVDKIQSGETNVDKTLIGETTLLKKNGNKLLNSKINNEKVKTNKFFCEQCGSSFSFKSGLSRHVIKAHRNRISKNNEMSRDAALEFCPEKIHNHLIKDLSVSDIKTRLKANFGKKHDSIKFPCDKCFETFDTQKLLKRHAKSHVFSCEVCRLSFTGKKELDRHRIDSNHNPTYACSVCSSVFDTEKQVMKHMRLHTGDSVNECEFCLKTFNQKHHLVNHLRQHTGEKPFECLLCGKKFRRKAYLQIHQISHTGEKLFKCDICSVSLSSKWSLRCHMKTHKEYANSRDMVDTLQYPCEDCGMAFKRNDALANHKMKVHTNERPFKCLVCGVGFRKGSHLMNHSRLHTGEKPFMCELCGQKFRRPSYLRDHARLVHGQEQPFKCEKCQKPFMTENTLQKHLITCTPGKPKKTYECHICQKNYVNKICFTNHISKCQKSSGEDFCTCGMKKPPTELKSQNVKNVESVNMVEERTKRLNDRISDKKTPSLKSVNNKRLKLSSETCIDNKDVEDMNDTDYEIDKSSRISDNVGTEIYSETNSCQDENSNGPSAENNTMPQTNWCKEEISNKLLVENNFENEELIDNCAPNFSCERCGKPFMVT
ncbi:zinc finger protein 723-like [Mytilus trossulus]|uniref:zinc finger protein 723-like n=1 Tax=Mytilus trossulus TaxID=6551 RepID=UPI003003E5CA